MADSLTVAATAGLAAALYLAIGLLVVRWLFRHRRLPRSTPGRILAFLGVQLVVLPTLDVIDALANAGAWEVMRRILPTGLKPLDRRQTK